MNGTAATSRSACGTRRTVLLRRPAHCPTAAHSAARPLDGRTDPAVRRRDAGARLSSTSCRTSAGGWSGSSTNRPDLADNVASMHDGGRRRPAPPVASSTRTGCAASSHVMLDEREFLSPHGVRALSRLHKEHPFVLRARRHRTSASTTSRPNRRPALFGGNSNWRGPVWFPVNYLLDRVAAEVRLLLRRRLQGGVPDGSGQMLTLWECRGRAVAAADRRSSSRDATAAAPSTATSNDSRRDPHWRDLVLFHEYFHGDTGQGLGASHQTGWTALVAKLIQQSGEH